MYDTTPRSERMRTARWLGSADTTMEESDTYLMIRDLGEEKATRKHILLIGEERFGAASESIKSQLASVGELDRLERMFRGIMHATNWQESLDTP